MKTGCPRCSMNGIDTELFGYLENWNVCDFCGFDFTDSFYRKKRTEEVELEEAFSSEEVIAKLNNWKVGKVNL